MYAGLHYYDTLAQSHDGLYEAVRIGSLGTSHSLKLFTYPLTPTDTEREKFPQSLPFAMNARGPGSTEHLKYAKDLLHKPHTNGYALLPEDVVQACMAVCRERLQRLQDEQNATFFENNLASPAKQEALVYAFAGDVGEIIGVELRKVGTVMLRYSEEVLTHLRPYALATTTLLAPTPVRYKRRPQKQRLFEERIEEMRSPLDTAMRTWSDNITMLHSNYNDSSLADNAREQLQGATRSYLKWLLTMPGEYEELVVGLGGPSAIESGHSPEELDELTRRFVTPHASPS
jgi:hypothetical protein